VRSDGPVASVVIAAHNEEAVIGLCLDRLLEDAHPGEFEVVVAANGCTDGTVSVARARPGVQVLDLPAAGKCAALNAGDLIAHGFPRIYLDADIVVPTRVARALRDALSDDHGSPLATFPARHVDAGASSRLVRMYYDINQRLPVFRQGLFGRGMVALSRQGRNRFGTFPDIVADDLYLDSLFAAHEKLLVEEVFTTVEAPRKLSALTSRLIRVRRGNAALRNASGPRANVFASRRSSWLVDVVLPAPRLFPAGIVYAAVTAWAGLLARRGPRGSIAWGSVQRQGESSPPR
jgi:glycosyltransferase involved in cell wall biosynthesis